MVHLPLKIFALGAALILAATLVMAPLGGAVQAGSPMHEVMWEYDMGSAHFDPNELPDEVVRDNGDKCDWWGYKLAHGRYVRYYHPCRYGDQEVDYSPSYRAIFQATTSEKSMAAEPEAALAEQGAPAEAEASTEEAAPTEEMAAAETAPAEGMGAEKGMVVPEVSASEFADLLEAFAGTETSAMLSDLGPFTVFAPTDAAFAALATESLAELLQAPTADAIQLLLYHIVPGRVLSSDLVDGMVLNTLQGKPLTVTVDGDTIMVDDATIIGADMETDGGVIHVIDAVLTPDAQ